MKDHTDRRPLVAGDHDAQPVGDILTVAAINALRSYEYGNSSPDLAKSVADKLSDARHAPITAFSEPAGAGDVQPVACVDENDDGLFVEILHGENGSSLKRGDKLYAAPSQAAAQAVDVAVAQGEAVAWLYRVNGRIEMTTKQLDHYWFDEYKGDYVKGEPLYAAPLPRASDAPSTAAQGAMNRDEQRLALWSAINAIKFGSPTDDKVLLDSLHKLGFVVSRFAAPTPVAHTDLLADYIELNMSNYDQDDVSRLNEWAIRVYGILAAAKPVSVDAGGMTDEIVRAAKQAGFFFDEEGFCTGCGNRTLVEFWQAARASTPERKAVTDEQREAVRDAIAEALGDAYDCTRVWAAWGVGTMSQDDFALVAEDESRLAEITVAALRALATPASDSATPNETGEPQ